MERSLVQLDIAWHLHMMEEVVPVAGSPSVGDLLAVPRGLERGLEIGKYECLVGGHR